MNVVVAVRPARRMPDAVRILLRRSTVVGYYCSSAIGFMAIVAALALWFQPGWRSTIAEHVLPWMASEPEGDAGAMQLLASVPVVTPVEAAEKPASMTSPVMLPVSAAASPVASDIGLGPFGAPLDPANLPASVVRLVRPAVIVADARYDHAGTFSGRDQARVASYIARRYRVAQEPINVLVHAAYLTGRDVGLDPLLLLAVMAVESGFNPYAESGVGARGLMQVMATVHSDKFEYYGGTKAALEPVPNLRVGALILKDYIGQTGSTAGGLRRYVGSTAAGDGGYGAKVLAERERLRDALKAVDPKTVVASGKPAGTAPVAMPSSPATPATGSLATLHRDS